MHKYKAIFSLLQDSTFCASHGWQLVNFSLLWHLLDYFVLIWSAGARTRSPGFVLKSTYPAVVSRIPGAGWGHSYYVVLASASKAPPAFSQLNKSHLPERPILKCLVASSGFCFNPVYLTWGIYPGTTGYINTLHRFYHGTQERNLWQILSSCNWP